MKTAGSQGEPAASISTSTPAIIAPLSHNPNSSSTTADACAPIGSVRPFDLDDLDALLDDLEIVELPAGNDQVVVEIDLPASARANFGTEVDKSLKIGPTSGALPQSPQKPMAHGLPAPSHAPENGPSGAASVYIGSSSLSRSPSQTEPKKTKRQQLKDEAAERRKARAEAKAEARKAKRLAKIPMKRQITNARFHHKERYSVEHRTLPRWKDLGVEGRALAAHDALIATGGEVYAFSLELDDETIAAADAARSFSTFIHGRIAYQLAKRFPDLPRDFALVIEVRTSTGDRPHPHLELTCTSDEIPAVLELLAEAGGRGWKPKRRGDRQAVVSMEKDADGSRRPRRPDDNWLAGYASKDLRYTALKLKGSPFASTRTLNDNAKKLFAAWREKELDAIAIGLG